MALTFMKAARLICARLYVLAVAATAVNAIAIGAEPNSAPPPVEVYGALPKTERLSLSPNGEMYAAVMTTGDAHVLVVATTEDTLLYKGDLGDNKINNIAWAGDNHVVIYFHKTSELGVEQDFEFWYAVVFDVKARTAKQLVQKPDKFVSAIFGTYGFVEENGVWHAYVGVIPLQRGMDPFDTRDAFIKQTHADLAKVNLDTGEVTTVAKGVLGRSWVLDQKGATVARAEYGQKAAAWKIDNADTSETVAQGKADYGFRVFGLGRTPGTVLATLGGADDRVVEINLANGAQEEMFKGTASLIYNVSNRQLVGAVRAGPRQNMKVYDPVLEHRLASISRAFKGATITLNSVSADLNRIVVFVRGEKIPGTWQLVDFKTGKASPLADQYPDIPGEMIGPARMYSYKAADGLEMEGVLTLPPAAVNNAAAKNLPVVIMPHGGPEAYDRDTFDPWAQAFAVRGYAVFQPNFRGSSGYGADFRNEGFGQWGRKMQTDISDGLAALAADGIVDPKRACIVGASYGGYAALAGVTLQQGLYRCAVSLGGISDPAEMLRQELDDGRLNRSERRYWSEYLGSPNPSDLPKEISPRANAAKADAPILLVHGEHDSVVSQDQSKDMQAALKKAGKPVEYIELKNEDHWLSRSATRLEWVKAMVAFVQKYNPA